MDSISSKTVSRVLKPANGFLLLQYGQLFSPFRYLEIYLLICSEYCPPQIPHTHLTERPLAGNNSAYDSKFESLHMVFISSKTVSSVLNPAIGFRTLQYGQSSSPLRCFGINVYTDSLYKPPQTLHFHFA